jgi:hypothetical protein
MIPIAERTRLHRPAQLVQPLPHLNPVPFTSVANFTVRVVDSQQEQQVASQIHDKPRGIHFIRLKECVSSPKRRELDGGNIDRKSNLLSS